MADNENTDDKLNEVFKNGEIFNASNDDLNQYLQHLSSNHVPNEAVRHREMNRCQVINTIKTFRLIDNLQQQNQIVEKENKHLTKLNIVLASTAIIVSLFSYWQSQYVAKSSSEQINKLINSQESKFDELMKLEKERNILLKSLKAPNKALNSDAAKNTAPVS